MAKIIIDGTVVREKGYGASRYTLNLIKNLSDIDGANEYHIFLNKEAKVSNFPDKPNFTYQKVKSTPALFWRLIRLPFLVKNIEYDIIHIPVEFIPPFMVRNIMMTIHEIPWIRHRLRPISNACEFISFKINELLFPLCLKKAKKIVTISKSTKNDLVKMYKVPPGKIEVIPEAAEEKFKDSFTNEEKVSFRNEIGAEKGYILNFVTDDARENTEIVLDAWEDVVTNNPIMKKLVLVGYPTKKKKELKKKVDKRNLSEKVNLLGFVDEEKLVKLYSTADIYVDISYYEGFGLQVVEAMACGTPVITSNASSLPEVVGEGGRLIEIEDKEGLIKEITDLLTDEKKRKELSGKAIKSAARFSWRRTAEQTLRVWKQVLEE